VQQRTCCPKLQFPYGNAVRIYCISAEDAGKRQFTTFSSNNTIAENTNTAVTALHA